MSIVRAPAVKWAILNSLPSSSYYQLQAILNSVVILKSPKESEINWPMHCAYIDNCTMSYFIIVFFMYDLDKT